MNRYFRMAKAAPQGRTARVSEKVEQTHIVQLLQSLGGKVYVLGTRRPRGRNCPKCGYFVEEYQGTRQTAGLSDLISFLPLIPGRLRIDEGSGDPRRLLVIECKAEGGRVRDEQTTFLTLCQLASVDYVLGNLDAVIAWLISHEYLKRENVPHYRQPREQP